MGSAQTALRALELMATRQPLGISELARTLGVSKPTAQRAVDALAGENWIQRSSAHPGRWVLTSKALHLAAGVGRDRGLRDAARPVMEELGRRTSEAVHLAVLDGAEIVVIDEVETAHVVRIHWPIGSRSPVHASANGKAILSLMPQPEREKHLPEELERLTALTITDKDRMRRELDSARERGYAVQRGELRDDVAALASPIVGDDGRPVAAVGLFIPVQRLAGEDEESLGKLVAEAASEISAGLTAWRTSTRR